MNKKAMFSQPMNGLSDEENIKTREVGHVLTDYEIDYLKNDIEIVARAYGNFIRGG